MCENILPLCSFGCGKLSNYKFKSGKYCCSDNTSKCPEQRRRTGEKSKGRKIIAWNKGLNKDIDSRVMKISIARLGVKNSPESNEKNRISNTGKKMPPRTNEWRIKQSQYMVSIGSIKANTGRYGSILPKEDLPLLIIYTTIVHKLSEINIKKKFTKEELQHRSKKVGNLHLDHIFSIIESFKLGILPQIVSTQGNLRLISESENLSKSNRCDITLEELFERFDKGSE